MPAGGGPATDPRATRLSLPLVFASLAIEQATSRLRAAGVPISREGSAQTVLPLTGIQVEAVLDPEVPSIGTDPSAPPQRTEL
jgi:hypothetical protein